jgi:hypothetical protein
MVAAGLPIEARFPTARRLNGNIEENSRAEAEAQRKEAFCAFANPRD